MIYYIKGYLYIMKCFSPDTRNAGGRYLINKIASNHKKSLQAISTSCSRTASPDKIRESEFSINLYTTKSSINKARGGSVDFVGISNGFDSATPSTFHLATIISQNKKRKTPHIYIEHTNELKHLQRRISEIGNVKTI